MIVGAGLVLGAWVGFFLGWDYLFRLQAPRARSENMGKRIRAKSIWFSPWLDFFKVFEEV